MNIGINKFRKFLESQGFSKTIVGNKEIWGKGILELSFDKTIKAYTYNPGLGLFENVDLTKAFNEYFNIA